MLTYRIAPSFVIPLLLAGCGYPESKVAHQAQLRLVGASANDLESCAGPPDKVVPLNPTTTLYSYDYKPAATGGFNLTLPLSLGGVSFGGSGTYCRAIARIVSGRVTELHYTGDDDKTIGGDGVCEPLIRGCMRQPELTMQPASAVRGRASAFRQPPLQSQPSAVAENMPGNSK